MMRLLWLILAMAWMTACDRDSDDTALPRTLTQQPAPATAPAREAQGPRVVFLGDSLTAGLGVDRDQSFPAYLAQRLRQEGIDIHVVNAGVSGDTSAGGLRRLDWLLQQKPDVVVVGLGANDGLRGLPLSASEENLRQIVRRSKAAGAQVLLLGMMIPPNYGPAYAQEFAEIYPRIARQEGAALVPFLLEGVGGEPRLNQSDGIHPTAAGHQRLAQNVLPHLRPMLQPQTGAANP